LPGAFNWVCQLPDADARQLALEKIIPVLQPPEATLDWVKSLPDSEAKTNALETCIFEVAKTDVPRALALAESLPEGAWRSTVISSLAGQADSSAVLDWINRPYWPPEIMQSRKAPSPWTQFLLNSNFGSPAIFPVETEILSNTTPDLIQIKPRE
jgi:hypothetical protein